MPPARPATRPEVPDTERAAAIEALASALLAHAAAAAALQARVAAAVGLGPADLQALDTIARHGPLTAGELGAHTGLASASVTGLIDRLEAAGFVRRVPDPADRRRIRVTVRPPGMRRVGEAMAAAGLDVHAIAAPFSTAQLDDAAAVLDAATARLRDAPGAR